MLTHLPVQPKVLVHVSDTSHTIPHPDTHSPSGTSWKGKQMIPDSLCIPPAAFLSSTDQTFHPSLCLSSDDSSLDKPHCFIVDCLP